MITPVQAWGFPGTGWRGGITWRHTGPIKESTTHGKERQMGFVLSKGFLKHFRSNIQSGLTCFQCHELGYDSGGLAAFAG